MLRLQQRLHMLRVAGHIGDTLLLLEHAPVISIGRSREAAQHLLVTPDQLQAQGIEVCSTNRGGDITYHGPGQLVVYYIMSLAERDIHRFIRMLEASVITLLERYNISGSRKPKYPGVWVQDEKICALGLYVRKWVTMHGIALNVMPNLAHFRAIIPCGIPDKGVTSLSQLYHRQGRPFALTMAEVGRAYCASFAETFQVVLTEGMADQVWQYLDTETGETPPKL